MLSLCEEHQELFAFFPCGLLFYFFHNVADRACTRLCLNVYKNGDRVSTLSEVNFVHIGADVLSPPVPVTDTPGSAVNPAHPVLSSHMKTIQLGEGANHSFISEKCLSHIRRPN